MQSIQNDIAEILSWECFHTEEQLENQRKRERDERWNATDFLENRNFTEGAGKEYSLQVMCQNLSNGNYFEYAKLYNEVEVIELYMFSARANAIYYSNKD